MFYSPEGADAGAAVETVVEPVVETPAAAPAVDDEGEPIPDAGHEALRDPTDEEWEAMFSGGSHKADVQAQKPGEGGDGAAADGAAEATAEQPAEGAEAAEGKPEGTEAKPAEQPAEQPAAPPLPTWESISDFDLEAVPETARPYVDLALKAHEKDVAEVRASLTYQNAVAEQEQAALIEELKTTVAALKDPEEAENALKTLKESYLPQRKQLTELSTELARMTNERFLAEHPDFEKAPEAVRTTMNEILSDAGLYMKLPGDRPIEKYNAAWRRAHILQGVPFKARAAAPAAPAKSAAPPPKPVAAPPRPVPPTTPRATLGSPAAVPGARGARPKTPDEVFAKHDHLPMPPGIK